MISEDSFIYQFLLTILAVIILIWLIPFFLQFFNSSCEKQFTYEQRQSYETLPFWGIPCKINKL